MIRIERDNGGSLKSFFEDLDRAFEDLQVHATKQFQMFCYGVFEYVLYQTPQWTGNAAANWNVSTGSPDERIPADLLDLAQYNTDKSGKFATLPGGPFKKGDRQAVDIAIGRNYAEFDRITLKDEVFLANSSESLSGKSYIMHLEQNPGNFLRAENEPGHMVSRAIATYSSLRVEHDFKQLSLPFGGFIR